MTKQFQLNLKKRKPIMPNRQKRVLVPSAVQLDHEARVTVAKEIAKRTPAGERKPHVDELIETILSYNSRVVRCINNHRFDEYPGIRRLLREELRTKFGIVDNFDWTEQEWEKRMQSVDGKGK